MYKGKGKNQDPSKGKTLSEQRKKKATYESIFQIPV